MPKFVIYTREIVCTRHTVVTDTIGQAKRLFLNDNATKQDFEVEETLSAWIVAPDGNQTPLDDIEEVFVFPLSADLGGGKIVVSATSLAEALAKVDHEIAKLGVGTTPPAPKGLAAVTQKADDTHIPPVIHAVDRDGPVRDLLISVRAYMIAVSFKSSKDGRYDIVVNGEIRRVYNLPSGKMIRDVIDGVTGAKNLVSVNFMPDEPGAYPHKGIICEVTLPPIPPTSTWSKPATDGPLAFEYLRVKPCLERRDSEIESFNSDEERDEVFKAAEPDKYIFRQFYTLYGVEPGGYEMAIGDFTLKTDALEVMNAILAPMAEARAALDVGSIHQIDITGVLDRAEAVSRILDDFISQGSNGERA